MNLETQLKLQAWLDDELPADEARELSALVERDPAAAELLTELKSTRLQLRESEPIVPLTESREFYWSKIERDIQRRSPDWGRQPASLFSKLRLLILPAAALTALVIVVMRFHTQPTIAKDAAITVTASKDGGTVVTTLASTDATTYRDASEGTTLVWFTATNSKAHAVTGKPSGAN